MRPHPQYREGPGTSVLGPFDAAAGRLRGIAAILAVVSLVMLFGAARAEAVPSVTFKCTPAPQNCSGWYRTDVSIDWTVAPANAVVDGCTDDTYHDRHARDERGLRCRRRRGEGGVRPEDQGGQDGPGGDGRPPARAADVNGWYNHAVPIAFSGSDQTSGIAACTNTTYGGPDSAAASLSGTCTDNAGNVSTPLPYGLKYDETAPVVAGAKPGAPPERMPAGSTGPVRFDLAGKRCDLGYRRLPGGDLRRRRLPDRVVYRNLPRPRRQLHQPQRSGSSTTRRHRPIAGLEATVRDRRVALGGTTSADAESLEVVRTPGLGSAHPSVVFRGPGTRFEDRRVRNGVRYVYELRVRDAAGNGDIRTVSAVPGYRLLSPALKAVGGSRRPPLLRWTPVPGARYYNLQLFRRGRKILSTWPSRPRYQLKRRWSYGGKRRRLVPGRYRWRVWPGFGPRSKGDYGKQIGPSELHARRLMWANARRRGIDRRGGRLASGAIGVYRRACSCAIRCSTGEGLALSASPSDVAAGFRRAVVGVRRGRRRGDVFGAARARRCRA